MLPTADSSTRQQRCPPVKPGPAGMPHRLEGEVGQHPPPRRIDMGVDHPQLLPGVVKTGHHQGVPAEQAGVHQDGAVLLQLLPDRLQPLLEPGPVGAEAWLVFLSGQELEHAIIRLRDFRRVRPLGRILLATLWLLPEGTQMRQTPSRMSDVDVASPTGHGGVIVRSGLPAAAESWRTTWGVSAASARRGLRV